MAITTIERIEQSRRSRGLRELAPKEVAMILLKQEYNEKEIESHPPKEAQR